MKQRETKFKALAIRDIETLEDCWILKTQEVGRVGTPDLIICYRGRFVAIELKEDDGTVSALQAYNMDKIKMAGGLSFVVSRSKWKKFFETLKDVESLPNTWRIM